MKTITRFICFVLMTAGVAHAQTAADAHAPGGTLGKRYTELGFALSNIRRTEVNAHDVALSCHLPVASALDFGAGFSHAWLDRGVPGRANALGTSLTAYHRLDDGTTPFATIAAGYQWGQAGQPRRGRWGATVGAEIPFGRFSFTPQVTFADDFRRGQRGSERWIAGAEGNFWFSRHSAIFAGADYADVHHSPVDSLTWRTGLRMMF